MLDENLKELQDSRDEDKVVCNVPVYDTGVVDVEFSGLYDLEEDQAKQFLVNAFQVYDSFIKSVETSEGTASGAVRLLRKWAMSFYRDLEEADVKRSLDKSGVSEKAFIEAVEVIKKVAQRI